VLAKLLIAERMNKDIISPKKSKNITIWSYVLLITKVEHGFVDVRARFVRRLNYSSSEKEQTGVEEIITLNLKYLHVEPILRLLHR
jgi:hypothetical protein